MNRLEAMPRGTSRAWIALASAWTCLSGCAVPATEVAVPTMSMQDALIKANHSASIQNIEVSAGSVPSAPETPGQPRPMVSAPDVRLAYFYEWIDTEGNKHFGEWVAIPVAGIQWLMNDGSTAPDASNVRLKSHPDVP